MHALPGILALLIAIAGWFYLFYSQAAQRLGKIEEQRLNRRRLRLRRVGGVVMLLLAVCFFAGFYTVNWQVPTRAFAAIWLAVLVLLGAVVLLALVDLRLTWKLRNQRRKEMDL